MTKVNNQFIYKNKKYDFVRYNDNYRSEATCYNCSVKPYTEECNGLNALKSCGGGVFREVLQPENVQVVPVTKDGEVLKVSETGGKKYDGNKPRPGLLLRDCNAAVQDIIYVLEHGAKKYGDRNWQNVENWRYDEAMLRHIIYGHLGGELLDKESHKAHLAHIACCVILHLQNLHNSESLT